MNMGYQKWAMIKKSELKCLMDIKYFDPGA